MKVYIVTGRYKSNIDDFCSEKYNQFKICHTLFYPERFSHPQDIANDVYRFLKQNSSWEHPVIICTLSDIPANIIGYMINQGDLSSDQVEFVWTDESQNIHTCSYNENGYLQGDIGMILGYTYENAKNYYMG